jgi:hypothetical protein
MRNFGVRQGLIVPADGRLSSSADRMKGALRWLWHKPHFGFVGRVEHLTGYHRLFNGYGGPMNGQTARLEIARSILENFAIARIVETGTYRGTTAEWFAQFGLPVVTAEISPRYAAFSRRRLRNKPNVDLRPRDSVTVLADLSRESIDRSAPTFFYLDAHWREDLPLRDELNIIAYCFPRAIVMIDDFRVPGDPGYAYDDYGPGKVLDVSLLRSCQLASDVVFFPSVRSNWETGSRRGCVVLANDPAHIRQLSEMSLLRPYKILGTGSDADASPARTHPLSQAIQQSAGLMLCLEKTH